MEEGGGALTPFPSFSREFIQSCILCKGGGIGGEIKERRWEGESFKRDEEGGVRPEVGVAPQKFSAEGIQGVVTVQHQSGDGKLQSHHFFRGEGTETHIIFNTLQLIHKNGSSTSCVNSISSNTFFPVLPLFSDTVS